MLCSVLQYLSKYALKAKKVSVLYIELQSQILLHINSCVLALSFVSQMLNKLIREHNWSAQEVSHILLSLLL